MDSCMYNTGGYRYNNDATDLEECPWIGNEGNCEDAEER